ncbi:MAG TPA: hypothetical protein VLY63_00670 [Anaerolineae bacterium]|nr:hypothetical protein [Anaerolineae bacterium]
MKRTQLTLGIVCLLLAAIVSMLCKAKLSFLVGSINVIMYPAVALAALGLVFVLTSMQSGFRSR